MKVICRFRGREIMHPVIAEHQLVLVMSKVEDLANVEQRPMMEARTMALLLAAQAAGAAEARDRARSA